MIHRGFDFTRGFTYPVRDMDEKDTAWIERRLLDRFLRYVRIDTTSDGHSKSSPTTPGQLELARMLIEELEQLSLEKVELEEGGFVFARLGSNLGSTSDPPPEIGRE